MTLAELVETFRANGISLERTVNACDFSDSPEATNMGPDGISSKDDVIAAEGRVLCDLLPEGDGPVGAAQFPTDQETIVSGLNVSCRVYPSSPAREREQVRRVTEAMRELAGSTP